MLRAIINGKFNTTIQWIEKFWNDTNISGNICQNGNTINQQIWQVIHKMYFKCQIWHVLVYLPIDPMESPNICSDLYWLKFGANLRSDRSALWNIALSYLLALDPSSFEDFSSDTRASNSREYTSSASSLQVEIINIYKCLNVLALKLLVCNASVIFFSHLIQ